MRKPLRVVLSGTLALTAGSLAGTAAGQDLDPESVDIEIAELRGGVYALFGRGGNIGISIGPDGVFIVDDQFAPLTEKITSAIREISGAPIRFVINTHFHRDHTGGNENLGGMGAIIVAHDNVRTRMSTDQFRELLGRDVPASPSGALPVLTFDDHAVLRLNGDEAHAVHMPSAHTDGDAIIRFVNANIVHMGDLYFNGSYPFFDIDSGGSLDGLIAAVERVYERIDEETIIIPGHGEISNRVELGAYLAMLRELRASIAPLVADGLDDDQIVAAEPTAHMDEVWAGGRSPDGVVRMVAISLRKTAGN